MKSSAYCRSRSTTQTSICTAYLYNSISEEARSSLENGSSLLDDNFFKLLQRLNVDCFMNNLQRLLSVVDLSLVACHLDLIFQDRQTSRGERILKTNFVSLSRRMCCIFLYEKVFVTKLDHQRYFMIKLSHKNMTFRVIRK